MFLLCDTFNMPSTEEKLNQAWQVHQRGDVAAAKKVYVDVLDREPSNPIAWCYLGIALHDQRQFAEAVAAYERAIRLMPKFPIALNNMGNSLRYLGRVDEADAAFQRAIDLQPGYFNAYRNRGTLHAWTGRIDLAFRYYAEAKKLQPEDAELHRNLGVIHLLQGDFQRGWEEYRYRWKCKEAIPTRYHQPKWTGQDLRGKTLLLYGEQGLGDAIHFIRFTRVLKDMGAKPIVHVQPQLLALFQGCQGIDAIIPTSFRVEQPFDYHCSLIDVADVLKIDTTNIPDQVPYIQLPENLIGYWKRQLGTLLPKSRFRVGLVWQGNPDHQADMFRSFALRELEPLSDLVDVEWVSLQFGKGSEQLDQWRGAKPIHRLPEDLDRSGGAFMDTASILHHLDWIVTSDTSMAHLSGALGRPTLLMLGYTPDWRWLLDRADSPWYPTMRLFRQTKIGDWASVAHQVRDALAQEIERKLASPPVAP
jgi:tetratricopeptide (TPR) repeat protein